MQFRVHTVEPYKLGLWRYGYKGVRPQRRLVRQSRTACLHADFPDKHFVETGVHWDHGRRTPRPSSHQSDRDSITSMLGANRERFLVSARGGPAKPQAKIAVLASTNTWNAYNPFGGRGNYILAARILDRPIVNSKADLPAIDSPIMENGKAPGYSIHSPSTDRSR